jgi:adenylate cyclase
MPDPFSRPTSDREVLESWKEIAAYLGRSVRSVQQWEKEENLPVHRHQHDKQGTVFAYRDEIDKWREARTRPAGPAPPALVFPETPEEEPQQPPVPAQAEATARRRPTASLFVGAILAAIVIATILGLLLWRRDVPPGSTPIRSVAVLPFTNSDPATAHMSDGLTELLIDELASSPDLRVLARASVFEYKSKSMSPVRAGKELKVGAVVTGDIRRDKDGYLVRAELIDVRDGAQVWSQRYATPASELPLMQNRIATDLLRALREGTSIAQHSPPRKYTNNAEAHEQYLLGLHYWRTRASGSSRDPQALLKAVGHFEKAIELDPQFALAYAGLANTYGTMVGWRGMKPGEGSIRVLANARKALELDPNTAEAHLSIAASSFRTLRDFEAADRNYRRAIALNPSFATAHQWFSEYLYSMGRFEEAHREMEIAYGLDPLSAAITSTKCGSLYYERKYREAAQFGRQVAARDPERTPVFCVGLSLVALGDFDAFFEFRKSRGDKNVDRLIEALRREGPRGLYTRRLNGLMKVPADQVSLVNLAKAHALLGHKDEAFALLEKAYQQRASDILNFHLEPELDSIRDDPRFADLARRLGLPPEALEVTRSLAAKTPFPISR